MLREPNNSRVTCWFKFGKNGLDAEGAGIYGSQGRDDFDVDDIEHVRVAFPFHAKNLLTSRFHQTKTFSVLQLHGNACI